jgi:hypothetical protein
VQPQILSDFQYKFTQLKKAKINASEFVDNLGGIGNFYLQKGANNFGYLVNFL